MGDVAAVVRYKCVSSSETFLLSRGQTLPNKRAGPQSPLPHIFTLAVSMLQLLQATSTAVIDQRCR